MSITPVSPQEDPHARILRQIESLTSHMIAQVRHAIELYFVEESPQAVTDRFFETFRQHRKRASRLSINELERYAPHWAALVPEEPDARAAIALRLGKKYAFTQDMIPQICAALGLDDPAVAAACQDAHDRPLESIYADDVPEQSAPDWADAWTASGIDPAALRDIEQAMEWMTVERGTVLMRQSDAGDSLYIVANGRLRIIDENDARYLDDLGRGEVVGEMSLITGERRSATVVAVRDTEVLKLSQEAFDRLTTRHPHFMVRVMRAVVGRFGRQLLRLESRRWLRMSTVALVPAHPGVPLEAFAGQLEGALAQIGITGRISSATVDDALGKDIAQVPLGSARSGRVIAWLSEYEGEHQYTIYQADATWTPWTQRCIRQADRVLIVGGPGGDAALGETETEYARIRSDDQVVRRDLVLLHEGDAAPSGTSDWFAPREVRQVFHIRLGHEADTARLARFLTGRAVGVVFSGGGVRAFAHIGVLRALHELGITPDTISGASAGAWAAALWAMGHPVEHIIEMGRDHVFEPKAGIDYTLPMVSIMAGRKLSAALKATIGDQRIEDLRLPYFCVTANISEAVLAVHRQGLLRRALRASMSLPGVYPPVAIGGDLHVDGTVMSNMPTRTMREDVDCGPVIAINVSPKMPRRTTYDYPDHVSGWGMLADRLKPPGARQNIPGLLTTLMRASLMASTSTHDQQAAHADIVVELPLRQFGLLDFSAYDDLIQVGYQAALEQLGPWWDTFANTGCE